MADGSTQAGFQFTFFCDICQQGFKSSYIQSKSAKKMGFLHGLEELANIGANIGANTDPRFSQALRTGANEIARTQQTNTMSASWHQEHDAALASATNEAKNVFMQCSTCRRWVCRNDWDQSTNLCVQDARSKSKSIGATGSGLMNSSVPPSSNNSVPSPQSSPQTSNTSPAAVATADSVAQDDPLKLLKLRLAKGEITIDEFEKLRQIMDEG